MSDAHPRIFPYRCAYIQPMRQEGEVGQHGLFAADPYDQHTPFVEAIVLEVHPACRYVQPGDYVITKPHCFETFWFEGKPWYIAHEENFLATVLDAEGVEPSIL